MNDDADSVLLNIVEHLYGAVTEIDSWPRAWQGVIDLFDGTSGSLFAETPGGIEPLAFNGFSAKALSLYADHYWKSDPWVCLVGRRAFGRTTLTQEYVPASQFEASETWQDFSRLHVGAFHAMGSGVMLADGATVGMFAIHRAKSQTEFQPADAARLDRLLPHLRNAIHLMRLAKRDRAAAQRGFAVLDAFSDSAFVVDGDGCVVFANAAAEAAAGRTALAMRAEPGRSLSARGKTRLVAPTAAQTARLQALIGLAARGGPGGGLRVVGEAGDVLRILVAPLPAAVDDLPDKRRIGHSGRVLVVAEDMRRPRALPLDTLVALYGFSAAEAAVAQALLDGSTAEDLARRRGVAVTTIRSQIRAVLEKTGARSLRDIGRFVQAP